jgi:hypothetical protein
VNAAVFISILVGFDAVERQRRVAQMDTCEHSNTLMSLCLRQEDSVTEDSDLTQSIELQLHGAGMLAPTSSSINWSLFTVSNIQQEPATGFYLGQLNPLHILTDLF